jgi:hypothetical protein
MYIGTFHSVCLRLLKENAEHTGDDKKYRMLDAFEQTYLVCRNIENFNRLRGYSKHIPGRSKWKQSLEICRYVNQLMEELAEALQGVDGVEGIHDLHVIQGEDGKLLHADVVIAPGTVYSPEKITEEVNQALTEAGENCQAVLFFDQAYTVTKNKEVN